MGGGVRLNVHANGGYDLVELLDDDEEGEMLEFCGVAMDPIAIRGLISRHMRQGATVEDHRTPAKRALAKEAEEAVERLREMEEVGVGVEPEALAKCRRYAAQLVAKATETSC